MTYRSLAAALVLLLVLPVKAQQGPAAHFFVYQVNPGAQAKFEDGYRRHLGWHRGHHDPLVWYGWTVADGKRDGYFIDASVGEPFAAFDHRVDVEQDGADFQVNVIPYVTPQAQLTYQLLPELSFGTPLENRKPSDTVQVTYFDLRPGTEARFERALQAAHRVLALTPSAPPHTWYRLVTGGDKPQYMLMVARANWASYDGFRKDLADLLTNDQSALHDFTDAVRTSSTETWTYHADLSSLP
ncbi:hypothetical protein ACFONN_05300 [Dyella humi]|uniref:NIPSNAP domain-containing protein n=1 Tax=Dyella humi TaxID=1770547 RepID=A0ABW8IH58_9GAMM